MIYNSLWSDQIPNRMNKNRNKRQVLCLKKHLNEGKISKAAKQDFRCDFVVQDDILMPRSIKGPILATFSVVLPQSLSSSIREALKFVLGLGKNPKCGGRGG